MASNPARKAAMAWRRASPPRPKRGFLNELIHDYAENSTLHGVKYMGDTRLHFLERYFWMVSFLLAVTASVYFITNLFITFKESPVILTLTPGNIKLGDIPFPAITLCNINNVRKSRGRKVEFSGTAVEKAVLLDICESEENYTSTATNATKEDIASWKTIQALMIDLSQPCHEMLVVCNWHGDTYDCMDVFNPSLSDEGICCTFNAVKREFIFKNPRDLSDLNVSFTQSSVDWKPEVGYPKDAPLNSLPWRPAGPGSHLGLSVVLDTEIEEYYCSSENSVGFKFLLHSPVETPKIASYGTIVSPGGETRIAITPKIMIANSIQGIDIEKRKCYYTSEKRLRFYRTYTQKNCLLECESIFTLSYCGCVLYHMPKGNSTRICGRADAYCAQIAQKSMELGVPFPLERKGNGSLPPPCVCYPGCHEISYTTTQTQSPLSEVLSVPKKYLHNKDKKYFKENMAILHFFFTETHFTGTLRSRMFGFTEFLSNTGGLLGLFLGFSFLSAVEIGYFLCFKMWIKLYSSSKKETKVTNLNQKRDLFTRNPLPYTN